MTLDFFMYIGKSSTLLESTSKKNDLIPVDICDASHAVKLDIANLDSH